MFVNFNIKKMIIIRSGIYEYNNTIRIIYIYCWPEELEPIKKNFKKRIRKEKLNSFFKKIDRWISLR